MFSTKIFFFFSPRKKRRGEKKATYESSGWKRLFNHHVLQPHFLSSKIGLKLGVSWATQEDELSKRDKSHCPLRPLFAALSHPPPALGGYSGCLDIFKDWLVLLSVPFSDPLCTSVPKFLINLVFCLYFICSLCICLVSPHFLL